jgi:hypothetical protein
MADHDLVGNYDWVKGGTMEKYSQDLSLRADGTASYKESGETSSEAWTRSGSGRWSVKESTVWVVCDSLKKETKMKKKPIPNIPGFEDEVKVDYNITVDIPLDKLRTAPPSGPNAPKNRWRKL